MLNGGPTSATGTTELNNFSSHLHATPGRICSSYFEPRARFAGAETAEN